LSDAPAVHMEGVDFAYERELVLREVNITIDSGDFIGVVGPNGGGKTTLLKLMLGLLRPLRGTVEVFGQPPERVCRRVGYVPQDSTHELRMPMTVADVVLMGRLGTGRALGGYGAADRRGTQQALERVGLDHLAGRSFHGLSGGERQRTMIARALVSEPEMLMLDEPTASVDKVAESEIHELLQMLNQTMTVILVSHDLGFVSQAVKSVLCVNRVVVRHPTSAIEELDPDLLREMFGTDKRIVRHDRHEEDDAECCQTSSPR